MADLGPCLAILFIAVLFPLFDLISLSTIYSAGWALNDVQLRKAATIKRAVATSATGPIMRDIPNYWMNTGLGRFVSVTSPITTKVTYRNAATDANKVTEVIVAVETRFEARPFLYVPWPVSVPGLNAPLKLIARGERPLEDPLL